MIRLASRSKPKWIWTDRRRLAVRLVARGDLWLYEVAAANGQQPPAPPLAPRAAVPECRSQAPFSRQLLNPRDACTG